MEITKLVERPPFANYDLVVYFGGGLFAIPFINRYIVEPTNLSWPNFEIGSTSTTAQAIIIALASIFSIYIAGHFIAYISSQLIEKAIERVLGKVSTAIIISSISTDYSRNEAMRSFIFSNILKMRATFWRVATVIRFIFHIPVIPLYIVSFIAGVFGYYDTRLPSSVMSVARTKMISLDIDGLRITIRTKWFKALEYWVINNDPSAVQRMYNYLIIAGLFRSLSFIFLSSVWISIYAICHYCYHGDFIYESNFSSNGLMSLSIELSLLIFVYLFSLFSFIKFQRRYAEEAIFAFALRGKT